MKQFKRILSFLMAVVILSSFINIYAGALAPYKDTAILSSQYDDLDKPMLTLNQGASLLLDFIDKKLKEKNDKDGALIIDMSILGTYDLSSVDKILDFLSQAFYIPLFVIWPPIYQGDFGDLNKDAITTSRRSSTPAATADLNVIYSIVRYISDNRTIFSKIVDGSLNLGFASTYLDLSSINVSQTIKKLLFEQAYPGTAVPGPVTDTSDSLIQQILVNLITNAGAPELAASVDLNSTAVAYDFLDKLLQDVYNLCLVPLMNTDLKKTVREVCGVVYGDPALPDGNESNLNEYAAVFDIDFVVPAHTFAEGTAFVPELNSLPGEIAGAVIPGYAGWTAGDNTLLLNNLASAAKYLLKSTDGKLFASYNGTAADAEIDAMTDQQLFACILRSVLNSYFAAMSIPADADTLVEVAWYALKEVLAQKVPQNNYSAQPKTLNGILFMLADIGVYYINQAIDMNPAAGTLPGAGLFAYGQGLDATLTAVMNWFRTNYGGLFNVTLSQTDGWAALDTLVFSVVQRNWLPADVTGCKDLLINRILGGVLDLDSAGLFALFDCRADSELATRTAKQTVINTAIKLINVIFPSAMGNYASFESALTNAELKGIAERLAIALYNRRTSIVPVLLPLVNKWLGIDVPQAFVNPVLLLPTQIGSATTFAINNESFGINTGATDKNGVFTQDALYKVKIVSLTSNIPAITPTDLTGTIINSGESVNCTVSGTFTANQVLMLTMTYDVYTELGMKLTDVPLTAMAFSYFSNVIDDGRNFIAFDTNANNKHTSYYKSVYLNQDTSLAELADARVQVKREKTSMTSHRYDATVSRTAATVNTNLVGVTAAAFTNATTTYDGGTWFFPVFVVDTATAVRPADGAYTSTFTYSATKTTLTGGIETWAHLNKSYVVFYDDFGLPALLESELNAKRDPADYTDADAWNTYLDAMKNAVALVYKPRQASTFMTQIAPNFEPVKIYLDEAVTALEACAMSADPYPVVPQVIDTINPPNPPGMPYDDPAYNYFGIADYVPYTYLNYQREVANCRALLAAQQLPVEPVLPANPTPEQIAAFNTAHAQWVIDYAKAQADMVALKSVDVAYALHRLNLYAGRLIPVQAAKARLNEAITAVGSPVEAQYTWHTWSEFERAYTFAQAVNLESATAVDGSGNYVLRQSKVDTARETLIEAYKQLVRAVDYSDLLAELEGLIVYAQSLRQLDYTPASWAVLQDALDHARLVYYMPAELRDSPGFPAIVTSAITQLQAAIDQLETIYNPPRYRIDPGPGGPGTGSTVYIMDDIGRIVAILTLVIFGDVNGDANIDSIDAAMVVDYENYLISWYNPDDECYSLAADVNDDGSIDSIDAAVIVDIENYMPYTPPGHLPPGFIGIWDDIIIIDDPIW